MPQTPMHKGFRHVTLIGQSKSIKGVNQKPVPLIDMKTPSEAHTETGPQENKWKKEEGEKALGGCLPPAAGHPLSVFHGVAAHGGSTNPV